MLIKYGLYLVNILVRTFEQIIGQIVGVMDCHGVIRGPKHVRELALGLLESIDSLLLVGKRYLVQVRKTMRYRLYFEAVTAPMRTRYRELKRR
jgi:hypothetical protein